MRLRASAGRGGRAGRGAGLRREQAPGGVTAGAPSRRGGPGQQAAGRGRAEQGMAAARGGRAEVAESVLPVRLCHSRCPL